VSASGEGGLLPRRPPEGQRRVSAMDSTINTNNDTKYVIQENSTSTSASHAFRFVHPRGARSCSVMQEAAERMTPVHMMSISRFYALPVLLENLVGKQEDDNDEGDDQKRAQYYVFDHDQLLVVKRFAIALYP
jgi:hypothetical protein